jgi:hypothetical protein
MITKKRLTRSLALAMSMALMATPLAAQRAKDPQPPPAPKETARAQSMAAAPTFENLLAADDYNIYGEFKNVGQLVRSPNVNEILEPIMKLANPPQEFKALVKFANAHAELLASSRMFFAAWPAKPKIPQALFGIEFSSTEEAGKFEPQLRAFLPTILPPPTPSPTPGEAASPALPVESTLVADPKLIPPDTRNLPNGDPKSKSTEPAAAKATASSPEAKQSATTEVAQVEAKQAEQKPAPLPFVIKQMGNLVLISDSAFSLKSLRPADSELLFDNPNFRQAHDRFGSEQIFLFFNVALAERKFMQVDTDLTEAQKQSEARSVAEAAVADNPQPEPDKPSEPAESQLTENQAESTEVTAGIDPNSPPPEEQAVLVAEAAGPQAGTGPQMDVDLGLGLIFGSLFGGKPKYPEAVGLAIAFEGDTYAARVLMVGGLDGKPSPVPFISQWVSGPALTPESPSIMPVDTELFVAASLDTPAIYEGLVKSMGEQAAQFQATSGQPPNETQPATPFAAFEKKSGLKVKEDLLPVLGNEIAVGVPVSSLTGIAPATPAKADGKSESDPSAAKNAAPGLVILISVKDKEAAHRLIPKIIDGLGFKGAGMLAQTTKRDDTEIVSYAGMFSYAFVGNFLVLSLDSATTSKVVDSYLNHQTLSSDSHFRNFTRWQPRQVLGQIYVSPSLMESYRTYSTSPTALISDTAREFFTRLSPAAEPVTYALSSDGMGPLHELHVPRNLLLMLVATLAGQENQSPLIQNEQMTRMALTMIASSEASYKHNQGKGHYATLEQLSDLQMVSKELFREHGYKIELTIDGDKFIATAVPTEYNKTGRLSYFVDESSVIRGGDHGGGPASVTDTPLQ